VVGVRFQKKYSAELSEEYQKIMTNQEKYDNLAKVLQASKDEKMNKSFQMQVLGEMLQMGPKVNRYSEENLKTFIDYMESINGGGGYMKQLGNAYNAYRDSHYNRDWSHILKNIA
jgi:hypothetical protein